jgi:dTDP-4-amino-4,6-dideoxygalactose transaminase
MNSAAGHRGHESHFRAARRAYRVVDDFEAELADYTGARYAVAVNSCTNALLLALTWERMRGVGGPIVLPRRTYVGVLQSALNAGFEVRWNDEPWQRLNFYRLNPTSVVDCARWLTPGLYEKFKPGHFVCLSFHAAKQLPLGRGGAILLDDSKAYDWFRAARMDGRPPGANITETVFPGYHCPMPPEVAARGLDILSRWNDRGYSPPPLPHEDYPDLSQLVAERVTA